MTITYHKEMQQNSIEWYAARCGLLTASEIDVIITDKGYKFAESKGMRTHMYNLMAQRITKYVEPTFQSFDMMRGNADEIEARQLYNDNYAPVEQCGFVTNDAWGFTLGMSPDGLVGDDGLIEIKSRAPKYQMQTIIEDEVPAEFMAQIQTCMLVSGRKWCDFVSYCGGLPMYTKRVRPDVGMQTALLAAASEFEGRIDNLLIDFGAKVKNETMRLIPTERQQYDFSGEITA